MTVRARIHAFDLVTAYGWGIDPLWRGLNTGQTAIAPTKQFAAADFAINLAATVPDLQVPADSSRVWAMLRRLLAPLANTLDPQTPVILATTVGEIEFVEKAAIAHVGSAATTQADAAAFDHALAANANPKILLGRIKNLLGLQGNAWVMSSACASSTAAISMAASLVTQGKATNVLVVAADALSEFVYAGFAALSSLSETPASPFDANRTGLSLGEAAAWMLITSDPYIENPHDNKTTSPTYITGWGSSSDASHMTAPDPAGGGLCRAISSACTMAHCLPSDAAFFAAHGTATPYSDAMELAAITALMPKPCPVFSIKGGIGHTLGAAGITQLLVAHHALQLHIVPPTVGLTTPDTNAQHCVSNQPIVLPVSQQKPRLAITTNSGFGGVNTAIILSNGVGR